MRFLDKLERRFGRYAVANVTQMLIAAQVVLYIPTMFARQNAGPGGGASLFNALTLVPSKVLAGEVWRVVTFLAMPPVTNLIFAFFFWYLFFLMGVALEQHWGSFRYNVYLLCGWAATVGTALVLAAFAAFDVPVFNGFVQVSVFLAFAHLYPNFEIYIFFILPVKVKWLALLTWIGIGLSVFSGSLVLAVSAVAPVANFLLFFGPEIALRTRGGSRRMKTQAEAFVRTRSAFHRCVVCGITDRSNPEAEFRYCTQCQPNQCYCMEHLHAHEHVREAEGAQNENEK